MLRIFNMLTKSKISEARCSDVENIVTMLSNEVAIHIIFCQKYLKTKPPTLSFQRFCKWRSHCKPDRCAVSARKAGGFSTLTIKCDASSYEIHRKENINGNQQTKKE